MADETMNHAIERFPEHRDLILDLAKGKPAFQSLVSEYNDVCERIAKAAESKTASERLDPSLENRRASLEEEMLGMLDTNRRL